MKTYQVTFHYSVEIEADDDESAEDLAVEEMTRAFWENGITTEVRYMAATVEERGN